MTKPYSQLGDNDGRCESCNQPASSQLAVPVLLAGLGPGGMPAWGTMWMCHPCIEKSGRKPPEYMPPKKEDVAKVNSHAYLLCDRCHGYLEAHGDTFEEAKAKLGVLIIEKRWRRMQIPFEDRCPKCQD